MLVPVLKGLGLNVKHSGNGRNVNRIGFNLLPLKKVPFPVPFVRL